MHNMFFSLVGLGGIVLSRATMSPEHAARCNQFLPKNMKWVNPDGDQPMAALATSAPIPTHLTGARKAWATRRAQA